tara:strand:+ start:2470 stop:2811 length:342 start_codon:yes stop_codon:yes gene_type:complete
MSDFVYHDDSEVWLTEITSNHYEEALSRVDLLLGRTEEDANGCWVRGTVKRPKTRFRGRQVAAARFVYCVVNREVLSERVVIRHRCHNVERRKCWQKQGFLSGRAKMCPEDAG